MDGLLEPYFILFIILKKISHIFSTASLYVLSCLYTFGNCLVYVCGSILYGPFGPHMSTYRIPQKYQGFKNHEGGFLVLDLIHKCDRLLQCDFFNHLRFLALNGDNLIFYIHSWHKKMCAPNLLKCWYLRFKISVEGEFCASWGLIIFLRNIFELYGTVAIQLTGCFWYQTHNLPNIFLLVHTLYRKPMYALSIS